MCPLRGFAVLAALAGTVACGSTPLGGGSPGSVDAGDAAPATTSNLAIDSTVTIVEFADPVLGGPIVKGDTCQVDIVKLRYDRTTHEASWFACAGVDGARQMTEIRRRLLTVPERDELEADFATITWEVPGCDGYDGRLYMMTTTTLDGASQLYVRENFNCYKDGRRKAANLLTAWNRLADFP